VRTIKSDLSKANWDTLQKVLEANGWNVTVTGQTLYASNQQGNWFRIYKGQTRAQHNFSTQAQADQEMQKITRLLAGRVATDAAKKFGFKIKSQVQNPVTQTLAIKMGR
jgi:hypothetical protein